LIYPSCPAGFLCQCPFFPNPLFATGCLFLKMMLVRVAANIFGLISLGYVQSKPHSTSRFRTFLVPKCQRGEIQNIGLF
jgi:hypothetical protein